MRDGALCAALSVASDLHISVGVRLVVDDDGDSGVLSEVRAPEPGSIAVHGRDPVEQVDPDDGAVNFAAGAECGEHCVVAAVQQALDAVIVDCSHGRSVG